MRFLRCVVVMCAAAAVAGCGSEAPYAEFRIARNPPRLLDDNAPPESEEDFLRYRQTQGVLVKSPEVLMMALHDRGIADLLKSQPYPMDWLDEHLQVEFPATEFMRIRLTGAPQEDSVTILNAVAKAYLDTAQGSEIDSRKRRIQALRQVKEELEEQIKRQRQALRKLMDLAGHNENPTEQQKAEQEFYDEIRRKLTEARLESMVIQTTLAALPNAAEADVPPVSADAIESVVRTDPVMVAYTTRRETLKYLLSNLERKAIDGPEDTEGPADRLVEIRDELAAVEAAAEAHLARLREETAERLRREAVDRRAAETARHKSSLSQLDALIRIMADQLAQQNVERRSSSGSADFQLDIEATRSEIARTEKLAAEIGTAIERAEIEQDAPCRVSSFRTAELSEPPER